MAGQDKGTTAWSSREANAYTSRTRTPPEQALATFMSLLPAGGSVLEVGCGSGADSETMLAAAFDVTPTDGTAEIAMAAAKSLDALSLCFCSTTSEMLSGITASGRAPACCMFPAETSPAYCGGCTQR